MINIFKINLILKSLLIFLPDTQTSVYSSVVGVERNCKQILSFLLDLNTLDTAMASFGLKISELRKKLRISKSDALCQLIHFAPSHPRIYCKFQKNWS